VLVEALTDEGHQVETAPDGAAALSRITEGAYGLTIGDRGMPVLGGIELYRGLVRRHPRLAGRVILVSGGTLNPDAIALLESIGAPRIGKPFVLGEVRAAVRKAMSGLSRTRSRAPRGAGTPH